MPELKATAQAPVGQLIPVGLLTTTPPPMTLTSIVNGPADVKVATMTL